MRPSSGNYRCFRHQRPDGGLAGRRPVRVPRDLSIVGFDNMPVSTQITPQLTTIAQDLRQKAALAVDILQRRLQNASAPAETCVLDVGLVERDSVRAVEG